MGSACLNTTAATEATMALQGTVLSTEVVLLLAPTARSVWGIVDDTAGQSFVPTRTCSGRGTGGAAVLLQQLSLLLTSGAGVCPALALTSMQPCFS